MREYNFTYQAGPHRGGVVQERLIKTKEKIMASLRAELTLTRKLLAQRLTHDNKQDYL